MWHFGSNTDTGLIFKTTWTELRFCEMRSANREPVTANGQRGLLVLESRKPTALVVSVRRSTVIQAEWITANLFSRYDLGQNRDVVRSAQGSSLVAVATFRIWHLLFLSRTGFILSVQILIQRFIVGQDSSCQFKLLFFLAMKGVLTKSRVVLDQFQTICSISLILGRRIIILPVFGADDSDDFSGF